MPRHHPRSFYDSTQPLDIPHGSLAAVYVNASGSFAWTQSQVERMRGVFGISESGDPGWMRYGRCVAVESGAATIEEAPNCLRARREFGHSDGMVYNDRSDWEAIERACIAANEDPDWWIAAPGLSVQEAQALRSPVRGKQPIAVQINWHANYDVSIVTGTLHFTHPREFHATG